MRVGTVPNYNKSVCKDPDKGKAFVFEKWVPEPSKVMVSTKFTAIYIKLDFEEAIKFAISKGHNTKRSINNFVKIPNPEEVLKSMVEKNIIEENDGKFRLK